MFIGPWLTLFAVGTTTVGLLVIFLLSPNLRAAFGPIDDHEPLGWIGSRERLPLSQFLATLMYETELGNVGTSTRFRPSYYTLRVLLAFALGDNPLAWYVVQHSLFVLTVGILSATLGLWLYMSIGSQHRVRSGRWLLGGIASFAVALSLTGLPTWAGVVTRLGPSELLAVLGFAVALLGSTFLLVSTAMGPWILLLAGTWISVFAKENFAPVGLLPLLFAIRDYSQDKSRSRYLALAVTGLFPSAVVSLAIALPLLDGNSAYPVYGGESRIQSAFEWLQLTTWYWLPALALALLSAILFLQNRGQKTDPSGWIPMGLIGASLIWFLFDNAIYAGSYGLPRYLMVTQLLKLLWIVAAIALGVFVFTNDGSRIPHFLSGTSLLMSLGLAGTTLASTPANLERLRSEAVINAETTQNYDAALSRAVLLASKSSSGSVLIFAPYEVDLEPARAIETEIQRRWGRNIEVRQYGAASAYTPGEMESQVDSGISTARVCIFVNTDPQTFPACSSSNSIRINARGM